MLYETFKNPILELDFDDFIHSIGLQTFDELMVIEPQLINGKMQYSPYDDLYSDYLSEYHDPDDAENAFMSHIDSLKSAYFRSIDRVFTYIMDNVAIHIAFNINKPYSKIKIFREKRFSWKEIFKTIVETCESEIFFYADYDVKQAKENMVSYMFKTYKELSLYYIENNLKYINSDGNYKPIQKEFNYWYCEYYARYL